ncbi:LysM peptidoglycan-binding domain-containing protein [Acinetobacter nosocomialis]|uniref:LysM peptidoglycan-binding domain-containing protein n=1 Tax=Acinetobacter nosocomialis TaxID=106654 RepID=UPI0024DE978B|nr:LysM peptidoglycan-binding domain-containing protein [Acinetobacter nosocomialis]MDO7228266.1 LysM peptidoglycan-binding domain-containing protein [Acinetobacter nosocomialis]HCA5286771.1 LysM peptidoglycan-binding domain-containing protein [Acinetobacter nosocomialis]
MYKPTTFVWQPSAASLFKITVLSSALAALGITTGCSSTPQSAKTSKTKQVSGAGYLDASSLDSLEDLLSATDMRAVEGDRLLILKHGDVWKRMAVGFKMDLNHWDPRIEAQRSWFISRQPYLDRLSARASRYLYHTVKEAERRGLPTELALLPVIESSYDPAATSSAAAAGLWQFIPSTGRIYGLQQTGMYDGRRDVVESTRAAYEFLGSLYNQFGSWELALAAYNAGPGRIQQAINRNQAAGLPTDYWSLKLPQETMNYVPRFLAVAQIIKNPRAYGVSLPPIANRPHFREVTLSAPLSLNEIASVTGLSRAELYALNPGYRGETVDPASPMRILIPADVSPSVDNKLKAMKAGGSSSGWWANVTSPSKPTTTTSTSVTVKTTPATQVQPVRPTTPTKTTGSSVTVKTSTPRGSDALAAFAASADVPSAPRIPVAVTPATNVKPVRTEPPISAVEREKILAAVRAEGEKETVEQALQPQATQAEKDQVVAELKAIAPQGTEIVDPYDGKIKLTAIQTSLSVAEQQGKELSKGFAYPKTLAEDASVANSEDGQRNKDKPYIKTDTDVVVVQPKGKRSTYTVQPGDTLAIIAMKNGVNWRDVAKWNQIDPEKTLFVGTSLYLYDAKPQEVESTAKAAAKPDVYVVQANDSLTGVANQFNLSVKQLAEYNDLSVSDGLFVGQKLHLKEPKGNRTSAKAEQPKAVQASTRRSATKSYTVKRGEYLKLIADRYALSNQELAELTPGLSAGSNLMAGQKINVPAKEVAAVDESDDNKASGKYEKLAAGPSYKTESYKVQRGDTLSSIATKSKISLAELAELNNLKANSHVQLGQNLKVPAGVSVPDHYVVQSGDSLHAIAAKYNLQTSYLADLNGLSRTAGVRAGQRLKLTGEVETSSKATTKNAKEETPDTYTVKSGDSLGNIANRYHLQLDYLASLNGLSRNSNVRVGQRLKLTGDVPPVETAKVDTAKSAAKPVAAGKNTEKYTVKAGESLHTIASRAGISVRELAEMNALKANANLQRGQNIVIPKTVVEYKVKRGDTLIGLASKYGLETTLLAELNNLTPSTQLRIGDIIKVPNL